MSAFIAVFDLPRASESAPASKVCVDASKLQMVYVEPVQDEEGAELFQLHLIFAGGPEAARSFLYATSRAANTARNLVAEAMAGIQRVKRTKAVDENGEAIPRVKRAKAAKEAPAAPEAEEEEVVEE